MNIKYSSALSISLSVSVISTTSGSSVANNGASVGEGGRPMAAGMADGSGDEELDDDGKNSTLVTFFGFLGCFFGTVLFGG